MGFFFAEKDYDGGSLRVESSLGEIRFVWSGAEAEVEPDKDIVDATTEIMTEDDHLLFGVVKQLLLGKRNGGWG